MILRVLFFVFLFLVLSGLSISKKKWTPEQLIEKKIEIGRQLFFDKALSNPDGQACTVCHAPKTAFSDPDHAAVSEGMLSGFFVNRNSQTLTYTSYTPALKYDEVAGVWRGGFFWDGRSNTLEHQLSGPFFNVAEMNNTDTTMLVNEIKKAPYYKLYKKVFGRIKNIEQAYKNLTESIALLESSSFLNEFSSKYDLFLKGEIALSEKEENGRIIFETRCSTCHSMTAQKESGKVLFTDYGYHNLGVPRNNHNPFYTTDLSVNPLGEKAIDIGLGQVVGDKLQNGKFKTPSLRNVEYTAPYFHNGYFKTLEEVVHFINTRNAGHYAEAEVLENIEVGRTGALGLSQQDERDICLFLLTLSDGYSN